MFTLADHIIEFNKRLNFTGTLPDGISVMNPFRGNQQVLETSSLFYRKFFNDSRGRIIILGINPGRFGAGTTGIPFTDSIRLWEKCGIAFKSQKTYEPSSVFIYEMIDSFGTVEAFYKYFLLSAVCPLGFVKHQINGKVVNYNYYDNPDLLNSVYDFIVITLKQQLDFGIRRDVAFCLGTGKNEAYLKKLNARFQFFNEIISLEHPRYVMQYKSKYKSEYINKYVNTLKAIIDLPS